MALLYTAHLDLSTICEELAKVKYKWWDIGLKLHIPYHKLKEFEKEADPLAAVINYWLNGNVENVPVTWRSIVAVLESSSVDEKGLAKTIGDKYCQFDSPDDKGWHICLYMCTVSLNHQRLIAWCAVCLYVYSSSRFDRVNIQA